MISEPDRRNIVRLIEKAHDGGARIGEACEAAGISQRTYQRWKRGGELKMDGRPTAARPEPKNKLTEEERQEILDTCHQPEFASLPPCQIVPRLADRGEYKGSESTFYRVLREADEQHHRGRGQKPRKSTPPEGFCAAAPNQVWTWDITWLPGPIHGMFFYLYMIVDIYSRKIVGWEVHSLENAELSAGMIEKAVLSEGCILNPPVLHADNGGPQKGFTMKAKLESLGIKPSYSRPRVSNDNPYSEALFRTVKYCPAYPTKGFVSIEEARQWTMDFVTWYNNEHFHSGIRFVTPCQRHSGEDREILENRQKVYLEARRRRPERWSGNIRNWNQVGSVWLNPDKKKEAMAGR